MNNEIQMVENAHINGTGCDGRKLYSDEYKRHVVEWALNHHADYRTTANHFRVQKGTVWGWFNKYQTDTGTLMPGFVKPLAGTYRRGKQLKQKADYKQLKKEVIAYCQTHKFTNRSIAKKFKISVATAYRWLKNIKYTQVIRDQEPQKEAVTHKQEPQVPLQFAVYNGRPSVKEVQIKANEKHELISRALTIAENALKALSHDD